MKQNVVMSACIQLFPSNARVPESPLRVWSVITYEVV